MTANLWSLTGRTARFGAVAAVSFALAAGAMAAPATAASTSNGGNGKDPAASAKSIKYTSLGDSYAAGYGAGSEAGPCQRSAQAYSVVGAAALGLQFRGNLGCFGATTAVVQASQVPSLDPAANVVTVTVGGNDVGSGAVAASCLPDPATVGCQAALQNAAVAMGELPGRLTALIVSIRGQAKHARILVAGYPHLFEPAAMTALQFPAPVVQASTAVNAATDQLNAVVAGTAAANRAGFVDVAGIFAGHGYPSTAQWINFDLANPTLPGSLHPNALGQGSGYAVAVEAAINAG
ncbi:SGNH/GDSL hydrolase family protein [Arthrobacter sp. 35W]|uniref:SGNH/GDSL hydrolase family protein n=1 Tax=Arthrobacter sp. 35W TaxID=1132441 RepID=UPI00040E29BF|nr:SGNH/GDSL hydrolase family protein [Arthrobacter sp. 35W]